MESYDNMTVILQDPTLEVYVDWWCTVRKSNLQ
jgi:hypothetical protein